MQDIPEPLSTKEMAQSMLLRHQNERTERKILDRYLQRKVLLDPKLKPALADIQGKLRATEDMIKFLEEVINE